MGISFIMYKVMDSPLKNNVQHILLFREYSTSINFVVRNVFQIFSVVFFLIQQSWKGFPENSFAAIYGKGCNFYGTVTLVYHTGFGNTLFIGQGSYNRCGFIRHFNYIVSGSYSLYFGKHLLKWSATDRDMLVSTEITS